MTTSPNSDARGARDRAFAPPRVVRWLPLAAVVAAYVLFAGAQHHARLRGYWYTWLRPTTTAWSIVRAEEFPTTALIAMLVGFDWPRSRVREILVAARGDARPFVRPVLRRLGVGLFCLFVASRLSQAFTLLDLIAILIMGAALDAPTGTGPAWAPVFVGTVIFSFGALTLVSYGFTVMKALVFVLGQPLDGALAAFETRIVGFDPTAAVAAWASHRQWAVAMADWVYYRTFNHLLLQLVFLAALGDREERARYIAAMSVCYVIGGFAYHLLPTLGPLYAYPEHYDYIARWAPLTTEFRARLAGHVAEVQSGVPAPLASYEYIAAMPSLHIAQEAVMTFYARRSRPMLVGSLVYLALMMATVVILGWHSISDVVAGLVVAASAIASTNVLIEVGDRWAARRTARALQSCR